MDCKEVTEKISNWMAGQIQSAGADGYVVALSGGIDSSVVLALAARAVAPHVLGVIMPCESEETDRHHALLAAESLDVEVETVVLDEVYRRLLVELPEDGNRMARANIKARLRMVGAYFFANSRNYLVAGTGNRSERIVGYSTKHGDDACDVLPIGDLLKTRVVELARHLGVPEPIIEKPPSAGLWPGQTDEQEMGIEYSTIDEIILALDQNREPRATPEQVQKVERMRATAAHKLTTPPICSLSPDIGI